MLFYEFASERSERAENFGILAIKLKEKMIKSMGNMKINKGNMYSEFASEPIEQGEIFNILAHKTNEKLCKIDEKCVKYQT